MVVHALALFLLWWKECNRQLMGVMKTARQAEVTEGDKVMVAVSLKKVHLSRSPHYIKVWVQANVEESVTRAETHKKQGLKWNSVGCFRRPWSVWSGVDGQSTGAWPQRRGPAPWQHQAAPDGKLRFYSQTMEDINRFFSFALFAHVCVHFAYLCVQDVRAWLWSCMWRPVDNLRCRSSQNAVHLVFLRQSLPLTRNSPKIHAGCPESLRDLPPSPPQCWG